MKLYLKSCERFHWPFDDASIIDSITQYELLELNKK